MNIELIHEKILEVVQNCKITSFPINCVEIMNTYGIVLYKYSEQSPEKQKHCHMVSDDAFTLKGKVFYNDRMPAGRIRFSLMHELGHILLKHSLDADDTQEKEANYFSGHLLAPRLAIHYARCQNEEDVSKLFLITRECAHYAFQDYRRWARHHLHHPMSTFEKAFYQHFYDENSKQFVYIRNQCYLCGESALNSRDGLCDFCRKSFRQPPSYHKGKYGL